MSISDTDFSLLQAIYLTGDTPTVKQLAEQLPSEHQNMKNLSSRLCELRKKGLTSSIANSNGINLWDITEDGMKAMQEHAQQEKTPETAETAETVKPETAAVPLPPVTQEQQSAELKAAITELQSIALPMTKVTEFMKTNPPFCADRDQVVSDHLLREADDLMSRNSIKLPAVNDALFVLRTLAEVHQSLPSFNAELKRIADYLEEVAA